MPTTSIGVTPRHVRAAVEPLAKSRRGRDTLAHLHQWVESSALEISADNQELADVANQK